MPVYLCQPGDGLAEPWKHGIVVFAEPCELSDSLMIPFAGSSGGGPTATASSSSSSTTTMTNAITTLPLTASTTGDRDVWVADGTVYGPATTMTTMLTTTTTTITTTAATTTAPPGRTSRSPPTVRRIRHAELVLADDVCFAYQRLWLRLRWPGNKGGFAGYIALGRVITTTSEPSVALTSQPLQVPPRFLSTRAHRVLMGGAGNATAIATASNYDPNTTTTTTPGNWNTTGGLEEIGNSHNHDIPPPSSSFNDVPTRSTVVASNDTLTTTATSPPPLLVHNKNTTTNNNNHHTIPQDEMDTTDDPNREETASINTAEPGEATHSSSASHLLCARTGLPFPSTPAMRLLTQYEDGICPPVALGAPLPTETVFCRICREGLHDDADEELPAAATDDYYYADNHSSSHSHSQTSQYATTNTINNNNNNNIGMDETWERNGIITVANHRSNLPAPPPQQPKGPVLPHPVYTVNAEAMRNPMLAPCECSGSMAFVHYLCVEQWRCRSRHPDARNGLHCETCGAPYALPPPAEREIPLPNTAAAADQQDDWLEAMPPHVMQALREPHIWWQMGAAIVRRRWLRPLAPVFMSPIVALYCRARRLLKKRGVARRRWACSLCRRRARWKCVRCLRSYYCSRQCQNVSWHIIHKHVCYKPTRMVWSIILYTNLTLLLFPGIVRDPFLYELGFLSFPLSFVVMGILGGSLATLVKKFTAIDLRGRFLEWMVLLSTLLLATITWGLIQGFFGQPQACLAFRWRQQQQHQQSSSSFSWLGPYELSMQDVSSSSTSSSFSMIHLFQSLVLKPAQLVYTSLDHLFDQYTGVWIRSILCQSPQQQQQSSSLRSESFLVQSSPLSYPTTTTTTTTIPWLWLLPVPPPHKQQHCFEHIHAANQYFFVKEYGGEYCASDLILVLTLYHCAALAYAISVLSKHRERRRQRQQQQQQQRRMMMNPAPVPPRGGGRVVVGMRRLHQD